jgi:hypothetical protein
MRSRGGGRVERAALRYQASHGVGGRPRLARGPVRRPARPRLRRGLANARDGALPRDLPGATRDARPPCGGSCRGGVRRLSERSSSRRGPDRLAGHRPHGSLERLRPGPAVQPHHRLRPTSGRRTVARAVRRLARAGHHARARAHRPSRLHGHTRSAGSAGPCSAERTTAGRFFPGLATPTWVIEGLATWYESRLTERGPRARDVPRDGVRTAILEGRFESLGQASGASPLWPGGTRPTPTARSSSSTFSSVRRGAHAAFVEAVAGQWIPYRLDAAGRSAFGVSLTEAWDAWERELRERYEIYDAELSKLGP